MSERPYLSIGEVLGLLLEEFPDVTISKIRFLESQGLIEPERTASGYRKFYDADVERLRFILREQRENYLPLKVIRDRLEGEATPERGLPRGIRNVTITADGDAAPPASGDDQPADDIRPSRSHPSAARTIATAPAVATAPPPATEKLPVAPPATPTPPVDAPPASPAPSVPSGQGADAGASDRLSRAEILSEAGIDGALLDELESFGLVTTRSVGQQAVYDANALEIARVAAQFAAAGIEVRHLRAYKTSAEREAGLYEQRILPLLRQRNPRARDESMELLDRLAGLGADLRAVLVHQSLRGLRDGR